MPLLKLQPTCSLLVDFRELFGYPSHLIINSWDEGVDWVLYVQDEPPELREYLIEAPVPLTILAAKPEYQFWYEKIPEDIRIQLAKYPDMGFTILYHISHYQAAYEIFMSHPILLWLLLRIARDNKWCEQKVIQLFNEKRVNILTACNFVGTPSALKLLSNLSFDEFGCSKYRLIKAALELPCYAKFNHHREIDFKLFSILLRFPEMAGSSLLRHYHHDTWQASTEKLITDIKLIGERLGELNMTILKLQKCKDHQEAETLHERLVIKLNKQSIEELPKRNFGLPPHPGTEHIIPILGSRDLAIEGVVQHHCVKGYERQILAGTYFVYKVLAPERATLGLRLYPNAPPIIDQLLSNCNKMVSDNTRTIVEQWLLKVKQDYLQ